MFLSNIVLATIVSNAHRDAKVTIEKSISSLVLLETHHKIFVAIKFQVCIVLQENISEEIVLKKVYNEKK